MQLRRYPVLAVLLSILVPCCQTIGFAKPEKILVIPPPVARSLVKAKIVTHSGSAIQNVSCVVSSVEFGDSSLIGKRIDFAVGLTTLKQLVKAGEAVCVVARDEDDKIVIIELWNRTQYARQKKEKGSGESN